jgi:hypothetical protein
MLCARRRSSTRIKEPSHGGSGEFVKRKEIS